MNTHPHKVFLLSPASCSGRRAQLLLRDGAASPLAVRIRQEPVALSEVFAFLSALYFRGKVAYSRAFANPPAGTPGALVITSSRGLIGAETPLTLADLREFAGVPIGTDSPRYRSALGKTAASLHARLPANSIVVLLGSIATGKYVDILCDVFGDRLRFPLAFVGRGDMSRGGLMLRCSEDGSELDYVPVADTPRRGARPPKLAKKKRVSEPR